MASQNGAPGRLLQLRKNYPLLVLILPFAIFVAGLAGLVGLEEEDLAESFVGVDLGGQGRGVRDLERNEAFPLGLERRDVHDDAAARIGALADADGQDVTGDLEVLHRPGERE